MNKLAIVCTVVSVTLACAAENDAVKAELCAEMANPSVQAEFDEPDGAAISLKDDGSFAIFGRGTGTYDFDDADDVNDAKSEAVLKAKAAIAKFMKEKLPTEEGLEAASKKVKTATSDGQTQSVSISKEAVKTASATIKNSADALLKGAVVLKMQKIARKGSTGEVQATVGISSKTLKAVEKLVNAIDGTPTQGGDVAPAPSVAAPGGNSSWTRTSSSDF